MTAANVYCDDILGKGEWLPSMEAQDSTVRATIREVVEALLLGPDEIL